MKPESIVDFQKDSSEPALADLQHLALYECLIRIQLVNLNAVKKNTTLRDQSTCFCAANLECLLHQRGQMHKAAGFKLKDHFKDIIRHLTVLMYKVESPFGLVLGLLSVKPGHDASS